MPCPLIAQSDIECDQPDSASLEPRSFQNLVHGFAAPDDAIYDLRQLAGLTHVKPFAKTSGRIP